MANNIDFSLFLQNLWERENMQGYNKVEGKGGYSNGRYYAYDGTNGRDVGPGFLVKNLSPSLRKKAETEGFTEQELNAMVKDSVDIFLPVIYDRIRQYGGNPYKLSNEALNGMLDMRWQLGDEGFKKYKNFWNAAAQEDYEGMRRESKTRWHDETGWHDDLGRWEFRKEAYFKDPEKVVTPIVPLPPITEHPDALRVSRPVFMPLRRTKGLGGNLFETDGGSLYHPKSWNELSMREKSEMMKVAVRNGITDLQEIRQRYNEFAEGGYLDWKEKANKYKHLDIDNDRTYDYEGWYNENPQKAWDFLNDSPDAHFDDKYKTAYHPTFSTQSRYSGIADPVFNPHGLVGGAWNKQGSIFTMSPDGYRGPVSMDERKWYLENAEDNGVQLREADGSLPIYDEILWGGVLPNVTVTGNKFAEGGIHIKPENRGKFTALKERTGHSATWFKEHGTPAQKKMATFALNARHWKHGLGGNLFDGTTMNSQQMNRGYVYDVLPRMLKEAGLDVRVTSGYRNAGTAGKADNKSWHTRHAAVDIVPQGNTTFDDIENALYTHPTISKYMIDNGFGLLDESGRSKESKATMRKTGATGAHFHIGKDSLAVRNYNSEMSARWDDNMARLNQAIEAPQNYGNPVHPLWDPETLFGNDTPVVNPVEEQPVSQSLNLAVYNPRQVERRKRQEALRRLNLVTSLLHASEHEDGLLGAFSTLMGYPLMAGGGHLYGGETEDSQQMNTDSPNIFRYADGRYVYQEGPGAEEVNLTPLNTLSSYFASALSTLPFINKSTTE